MRTQRVYIARHGETNFNKKNLTQHADDELSEYGHEQAINLSNRIKSLDFGTLFSSEMKRARQTAQHISEINNLELVTNPLLFEVRHPARFFGISRDNNDFMSYIRQKLEAFSSGKTDWQFDDEETFAEVLDRAEKALDLFAEQPTDLFIVSHGHFARFLAAHVIAGRRLTPERWVDSFGLNYPDNASISLFERDLDTGRWMLSAWNDVSHLVKE